MGINVTSSSASYNFLLKNYYSRNREAAREVTRGNVSSGELVTADASALSKISKALRNLEYSTDNGVGIYNNVKAFADAYNNLISSTTGSASYDITHPNKLLKNLVKSKKDDLESLGITVSASGRLTIDKEALLKCSPEKIAGVFSSGSDFTQKVQFYANKIYRASDAVNLAAPGNVYTKPANTAGNGIQENDALEDAAPGETKSSFNAVV